MSGPHNDRPSEQQDAESLIKELVTRNARFVLCGPVGQALDKPWESHIPDYQAIQCHIEGGRGLLGIVPDSIGCAVITVDGGGRESVNAVKRVLEVETVVGVPTGPGGYYLWFRLPVDGQDMPSRLTTEWDIQGAKGDVRIGTDFVLIRKPEHLGVILSKANRHLLSNSMLLKLKDRGSQGAGQSSKNTRTSPSYRTRSGPPKEPPPTFDDWRGALPDLKQRGRQGEGACPLCGGQDRFHLNRKPDGGALVGCRNCMSGSGQGARFGEMLRAVFPDRFSTTISEIPPADNRGRRRQQIQQTRGSALAQPQSKPLVEAIWAASVKPDETPARLHLARRLIWPPEPAAQRSVASPIRRPRPCV